jgi:transposase
MARYKIVDRSPRFLPVILEAQLMSGSFEYALDYLIDHQLDLSALDHRYRNDATGSTAYDPRVLLKIILLAYSRGMISSRSIERACRENVLFMALSGDSAPQFTTLAKFVRELRSEIAELFTQVLMTCDAQGLIGRQMFAIDGVKLPSNASKKKSGTHTELTRQAERMETAVATMLATHQQRDETQPDEDTARDQQRLEQLATEAARIREFLATHQERRSRKGAIRKSNRTDNESAKMATSKGVIQGYTGIAAVDAKHQIIVAANAHGSGSEQEALLPMIERTDSIRTAQTLITADAGYHSEANLKQLHQQGISALIADGQMRKRDPRLADQAKHQTKLHPLHNKRPPKLAAKFRPKDFNYDAQSNTCICPAGKSLYSNGNHCTVNGRTHHKFQGSHSACGPVNYASVVYATPTKHPHGKYHSSTNNKPHHCATPSA